MPNSFGHLSPVNGYTLLEPVSTGMEAMVADCSWEDVYAAYGCTTDWDDDG